MPYSQSVLITLVVLFKQIKSNAMKMVQGRLTSFYSFSRETNWVSIFRYLIWNRFYTKSNEKNNLVINNLLRLTSYHTGNSPASKFLQHSRQHRILTSGLWFNKRAIFSLIVNLSTCNTYNLDFHSFFRQLSPKFNLVVRLITLILTFYILSTRSLMRRKKPRLGQRCNPGYRLLHLHISTSVICSHTYTQLRRLAQ